MRDRLIELLCNVKCEGEECFGNCPHRIGQMCNKVQRLEMCSVFAIADHLIAAGVIVPPCKVGDKVFVISDIKNEIHECRVSSFEFTTHDAVMVIDRILGSLVLQRVRGIYLNEFGKTVFLTREEAEKALERSENGKS